MSSEVTLFDELRDYVKAEIEKASSLPAFFMKAPNRSQHPYITFELRETYSQLRNKLAYSLIIDGWDRGDPKKLITANANIRKSFKEHKAHLTKSVLTIYTAGSSEFVEDEDKDIRHLIATYDVFVYEKER